VQPFTVLLEPESLMSDQSPDAAMLQKRMAGTKRYLSDPRRAKPMAIGVIIAAWRRGWSYGQIAFASGLSHQRVHQLVTRYEAKNGTVPRIRRPIPRGTEKFLWRCANCGVAEWSPRVRISQGEQHFCSAKCSAAYARGVTDQQIEDAIYLRWEGNSWSHIARLIGFPVQTIQMRIWKYLYATGQLNRGVIESIWVAEHLQQGRPGAWHWLELNTGIYCTEHGAEYGFRRAGGSNPWGQKILSDGNTTR
jgi:hypothetical protein